MTKIKLEIELNSDGIDADTFNNQIKTVGSVMALLNFNADTSNTVDTSEKVTIEKAPESEKPVKRTRRTKGQQQTPQEEPAPKTRKRASRKAKAEPEDGGATLLELRSLLREVLQNAGEDARDMCAEKLKDLDAKNPDTGKYNVSSLDESKYDEFKEFLEDLMPF